MLVNLLLPKMKQLLKTQIQLFLEELKYPTTSMILYENIYPSLAYPDAMVYTMEVPL